MKKAVIIFDIDGTLADNFHRQHFLTGEKKDWDGFYSCVEKDKIIPEMRFLFHALYSEANLVRHSDEEGNTLLVSIIFVTGRPDYLRESTEKWILKNLFFGYFTPYFIEHEGLPKLYMRKSGDHRPDYQVKQELLDAIQADGSKVLMTIDDRKQVVDMWRKNGIRCLQCAEGNF